MSEWQTSQCSSFDGEKLFYRYCEPNEVTDKTLVFLHRGHEHSERVVPFANALAQGRYWCFAYDMRGHGNSGGLTAWAESFDVWVKDLNSFIGMLRQKHNIEPQNIVVVSNSVGSAILLSWVLHYGPGIKAAILGAPAFSIKLYVPFAYTMLRLASQFNNKLFVSSYVRSNMLTSNAEEAQRYDSDPKITKKIGVNILVSLLSSMKRIFKRLQDFETPVLLISAGKDVIVRNQWHSRFMRSISSTEKQHLLLDDFKHAIFHEKNSHQIVQPCHDFLQRIYATGQTKLEPAKHLPAIIEPRPHTLLEYQRMLDKGSRVQQLYYWAYRKSLVSLGCLSDGVALGVAQGFDSGASLDYVYRNQASGRFGIGILLDKVYLNSVGWRNIRKRKQHLLEMLKLISNTLLQEKTIPVLCDLASGAGRYLFELSKALEGQVALHLNDIDPQVLTLAQANAQSFAVESVSYSQCDIFKDEISTIFKPSSSSDHPAPNIVVVSGVFELYANNEAIVNTLRKVYQNTNEGSYLVYSGQPWHPQLELISRLLNNRNGQRWVMRRRVQAEMDELVTAAGFSKIQTFADDMGIFTISCAKKIK